MGHSFREVDGKPHRVVPEHVNLGPGRRRAAQGRLAHADRAGDQGRRARWTSPRFREVYEDLIAQDPRRLAVARRHAGRDDHAHQPRRHRHRRLGAAADAGPGHASSRPARSLPPAGRAGARGARRLEGHDDDLDLRPPRDPGRRVGRVPGAGSRSCCRARTASTRASSESLGARAARRRAGARRAAAAPRRRAGRARRPRRCSPTCRRRPRSSRRTACTATSPRGSTRSAREPIGDPALEPETVGLTPEVMAQIPAAHPADPGARARRSPRRCRTCARPTAARSPTRSSTSPTTSSACGCGSGSSPASTGGRCSPEEKKRVLARLTDAEALETYLHRAFLGPEELLDRGPRRADPDARRDASSWPRDAGVREAFMGMAHRGRLNVLAHAVGRPVPRDPGRVRGREGHRRASPPARAAAPATSSTTRAPQGTYTTRRGQGARRSRWRRNPSHLEFVDPVVEGRTRADQTERDGPEAKHDPRARAARS